MARIVYYKADQTIEKYDDAAISDYVKRQKTIITKASNDLGVSQISNAIAGAMAEENNGYIEREWREVPLDKYALSGLTAADLVGISLVAGLEGPMVAIVAAAVAVCTTTRTHQEWEALYAKGNDESHSTYEKITNPVLLDIGKANIKMYTAIRLLNDSSLQDKVSALGLTQYKDHYDKLAYDLVNDDVGLAAKIYGLMILEADNWYRDHKAYGSDWNNLPQEIKDALYITYTNIGKGRMETSYSEHTKYGKSEFYVPLPAAGDAGGLNHLFNAKDIAAVMGDANYGNDISFCDNTYIWADKAAADSDEGAAYREALLKLRPFVVQDGSYSPEAIDAENFSPVYLWHRTLMLSELISLKYSLVKPDSSNTYIKSDWPQSILYEDKATGVKVKLGTGEYQVISFGDATANKLVGGNQADYLYGMDGDDKLNGGKGNDTLYGGEGIDTYVYNIGDGNDIIIDSDKKGRIIIHRDADFISTNKLYRDGDNEIWTDATGKVRMIHDTTWKILLEDGGTIQLGEVFTNGDFGIHLTGLPEAPANNNGIISGDLAPIDFDPTQDGVQMEKDALGNIKCDPDEPMPGRSDYLHDDSGNERIEGKDGNDFIYQGLGDDRVLGGNGRDGIGVKVGESSGNDLVEGGADADIIYGGDGDDQLFGESLGEMSALIAAGEVAEGINEQGELIGGGDGNDYIYGAERNDALFGGAGQDLIVAGAGNDFITSGGTFDGTIVYTNNDNGAYTYQSGPLFDWNLTIQQDESSVQPILSGFTSYDMGTSDIGDDVVYAGAGNDFIYAAGGNDQVYAGNGNDTVFGWGGNDDIFGEDGNDLLVGDNDPSYLSPDKHGDDYIDGGAGNDRIFGMGNWLKILS